MVSPTPTSLSFVSANLRQRLHDYAPPAPRAPAGASAPPPLSPPLDLLHPPCQKRVRLIPIKHAMVDRKRHVAHWPHLHRLLPALLTRHRPPLQLADAEYRRLRLRNDDRRRDEAAAHAVVRDREG